jgi:hypothetical protein
MYTMFKNQDMIVSISISSAINHILGGENNLTVLKKNMK